MSGVDQGVASRTQSLCHRILRNELFDPFFGVILVFNLGLVVIETDATARKDEKPVWVEVMNWVTLLLFILELALRLYVFRWSFWHDGFNVLDFVLVFLDFVLNSLTLLAEKSLPEFFLQTARLSKLARTAKAFRVFPELRLWMSRFIATFKATLWRAMPLVLTLLVWSIVAVQFIHPLNQEVAAKGEYENCERCPQAYASIHNAFITFCHQIVVTEGWGPSIKPVIDHYPMSLVFYTSVFVSVALAILNLILGLVNDVASGLQENVEDDTEYEHLSQCMEVQARILELRRMIGRGARSAEALRGGYTDDEFPTYVAEMDIPEDELRFLWNILDADNSGKQQAPYAFRAESLALDWGLQHLCELAETLPLFG